MAIQVVVQPSAPNVAEVVSPSPGVRQLVARVGDASFVIQVPARIGGVTATARFARSLAAAAGEFGDWCEEQSRSRTYIAEQPGPSDEHKY